MTPKLRHLSVFLVVLAACTDGRVPRNDQILQSNIPLPQTDVIEANPIQVKDQTGNPLITNALQMVISDGHLYFTGSPSGLAKANVSANPEAPGLLFSAGDRIDTAFPFGKWIMPEQASGALDVFGSLALTSGVVGSSLFTTSNNNPVEVRRYPRQNEDQNAQTIQDVAYVYKALVHHPTQPLFYGFGNENIFVLRVQQGPQLSLVAKYSYTKLPEVARCCAQSAAVFNKKIFVATKSALVIYDILDSGELSTGKVVTWLTAERVAASPNYLFIYHNPSVARPEGVNNPRGTYVFDSTGNNIAILNTPMPFSMAATDGYLYINSDNQRIRIYRINWNGTTYY